MNILDKKPEQVDAIILSRLEQFPKKGGKGAMNKKWTEEELHLRDGIILDYLRQMSREQTAQQISARWNIGMSTARMYVKQAVTRFAESFNDDYEELKKIFLERVENLYDNALTDGQKDVAARALDMYAKGIGAYTEKKDINLNGNLSIDFDFE